MLSVCYVLAEPHMIHHVGMECLEILCMHFKQISERTCFLFQCKPIIGNNESGSTPKENIKAIEANNYDI